MCQETARSPLQDIAGGRSAIHLTNLSANSARLHDLLMLADVVCDNMADDGRQQWSDCNIINGAMVESLEVILEHVR